MRTLVTRIRNSRGPLSKSITLRDGKLVKAAAAELVDGYARHFTLLSISHLAETVEALGTDEALTFGVCRHPVARVTTQKRHKGSVPDANPLVCRDREHFGWPSGSGVLMLDVDAPKDGTAPLTAREFDGLLTGLLPWWAGVGRMYRPSASAFIYGPDGTELSGRGSLRCYAICDIAANIPFVGVAIADALWRAGMGRIEFSAAGSMLPRCPVDTAVWQPERLDFAGPPVLGLGLRQRRFPALVVSGDVVPSQRALEGGPGRVSVSKWQNSSLEISAARNASKPAEIGLRRAYVDRRVRSEVQNGVSAAEASKRWRRAAYGSKLGGSFQLTLRDGTTVSVAEVLQNPTAFDQMRCRDPLDPAYADDERIAMICANAKGAIIYSHAHGGVKYTLSAR